MKTLIDLGIKGHYPLFHRRWLNDLYDNLNKKLNKSEKKIARQIMKRVEKHKSLERKKTVLLSLQEAERIIFMKAFFDLVENRILDNKPDLH